MTPQASSCRRWCLVLLAFTEVLTATGIMFGMSAASLATQREGVYAELCSAPASAANAAGACNAQALRLNIVYAAGATAIPLAMMVWGPMMDRYGARAIRVTSLTIFITGTLLFGLANHDPSTVLDAYTLPSAQTRAWRLRGSVAASPLSVCVETPTITFTAEAPAPQLPDSTPPALLDVAGATRTAAAAAAALPSAAAG